MSRTFPLLEDITQFQFATLEKGTAWNQIQDIVEINKLQRNCVSHERSWQNELPALPSLRKFG